MKKYCLSVSLIFAAIAVLSAQTVQPAPAAQPTVAPAKTDDSGGQSFTIRAAPGLVITGVTTICKGGESTLKVEGEFESFLWNTGSTERFLRIKEAGVYEVTVKTKGGCSITGAVNVEVISCL